VSRYLSSPAVHAELALEKTKLLDVIKTLSPRDQEVLDLKFFGEQEATEIASILQISPNHAAVLVYRATARLSAKYKKLYGT
jgi:RNA polymerase sigma factor (sigma-70 family)